MRNLEIVLLGVLDELECNTFSVRNDGMPCICFIIQNNKTLSYNIITVIICMTMHCINVRSKNLSWKQRHDLSWSPLRNGHSYQHQTYMLFQMEIFTSHLAGCKAYYNLSNVIKWERYILPAVCSTTKYSAHKHAFAFRTSNQIVRRILYTDLKFHPYEIMVVQQFQDHDWQNQIAWCETILENQSANDMLLSNKEAHFYLNGCLLYTSRCV